MYEHIPHLINGCSKVADEYRNLELMERITEVWFRYELGNTASSSPFSL
jgi:hypothetical protein